jgi:hypothetical protein
MSEVDVTPIETDQRLAVNIPWCKDSLNGYVYSACAALLGRENPQGNFTPPTYPLFKPELNWELKRRKLIMKCRISRI